MRMTNGRFAEIREELAKGSWGFVRKKHKHLDNATGRLWFGKSADDFNYSCWVDNDADRMEQLVRRANMADELLAELDNLKLELANDEIGRGNLNLYHLEGTK